jgi:hypothetical protein
LRKSHRRLRSSTQGIEAGFGPQGSCFLESPRCTGEESSIEQVVTITRCAQRVTICCELRTSSLRRVTSIPIRPTSRVLAASQFRSFSSSESLASCRERASSDRELPSGVRECRPALTPPARDGCKIWRSGWKNARGAGRTKEWDLEKVEEAGSDLQGNCACVPPTACHNGSSLRTQWVH